MPPRMAPSAVASLPDSNHLRPALGGGAASCMSKSMPAAAPNPTLMPARLAAMAAGPLSARRFSIGAKAVDADHEVEPVGQTFHRVDGQAKQPCRFTAADLGAHGAGKQPLPAGGDGRFEQGIHGG